jgi:DNA mismatch repair ATPase MutS
VISFDGGGNLACLYRIQKGFVNHSHGIEVAQIAGMIQVLIIELGLPQSVIESAFSVHSQLKEQNRIFLNESKQTLDLIISKASNLHTSPPASHDFEI